MKTKNRFPNFLSPKMRLFRMAFFTITLFLFSSIAFAQLNGGTISTNNNTVICVDNDPDIINIQLTNVRGLFSQWLVTDENNVINIEPGGRPPYNANNAPPGVYRVYHVASDLQ